ERFNMKIKCTGCSKVYNIPEERLPSGELVSFPCPACKNIIQIDLRSKSDNTAVPSSRDEAAMADNEEKDFPKGEALQKIILRRLKELPPMPQVMFKAREVMNDPKSNFKALSDILESDQAMAARVLRLSNSAYYGLAGKVSSVQHASVLLGYKTVGEIVSMAGSSSLLGESLEGYRLDSGDLWQHSLAVALASKIIAQKIKPDLENDAFAAGLIHDSGKIVLDRYLQERHSLFEEFMKDGQKTFLEAEKNILGFDHSEIAAQMCASWKIPNILTNAVCYHHHPSRSNDSPLAYIVHVADSLSLMSGIGTGVDGMLYKMDSKALEYLRLPEDSIASIIEQTVDSVQKIVSQMQ
ncbi:MAG: zinc-ribbon domain-containing protein, partial [Deltaproteobacteria bacterium]|nr:zinc-ribbon domain-containing protein [Deltaproteobacteria bacterium]